jgi:hypothetical protein
MTKQELIDKLEKRREYELSDIDSAENSYTRGAVTGKAVGLGFAIDFANQLDEPPAEPCEYCSLLNKSLNDMLTKNQILVPYVNISFVQAGLLVSRLKAVFCPICGRKL